MESACADDPANPFELLVVRRAEATSSGTDPAAARPAALAEASETITPEIEKHARLRFPAGYERDEVRQEAWEKLRKRCGSIWDGAAEPPPAWRAFVRRVVWNAAIDVRRDLDRQGVRWLPRSGSVVSRDNPNPRGRAAADDRADRRPARSARHDDTVTDAVTQQAAADELLRRVQSLREAVESDEDDLAICVFHPARRCEHLRTGSIGTDCANRSLVFDEIARVIASGTVYDMNPVLAARAGYDAHRSGSQLHRTVYRCRDWFAWLLMIRDPDPSAEQNGLRYDLEAELFAHLTRSSSATTACILMNDFPELPIPRALILTYGPVHRRRSEGESR